MGSDFAAIWERILQPDKPEKARAILDFRFSEADVDRMNGLAAKAREGTLSNEEAAELDDYEQIGIILSIMQSKARMALKQKTPAA